MNNDQFTKILMDKMKVDSKALSNEQKNQFGKNYTKKISIPNKDFFRVVTKELNLDGYLISSAAAAQGKTELADVFNNMTN